MDSIVVSLFLQRTVMCLKEFETKIEKELCFKILQSFHQTMWKQNCPILGGWRILILMWHRMDLVWFALVDLFCVWLWLWLHIICVNNADKQDNDTIQWEKWKIVTGEFTLEHLEFPLHPLYFYFDMNLCLYANIWTYNRILISVLKSFRNNRQQKL